MDEISVSEENKKLAKSTWDSLDVQGSGFELLGNPIVSRLENQDVSKSEPQGEKQPKKLDIEYLDELKIKSSEKATNLINIEKNNKKCKIIKSDKFTIKRDINYNSLKNRETTTKEEYMTTTEKTNERDSRNQTYKVISQNVNASKNLQKSDDFNTYKKSKDTKDKKQSTKYRISGRDSKMTEDSDVLSESQTYQSHTSQKVTKYLTKQEKKPEYKPRTREERRNLTKPKSPNEASDKDSKKSSSNMYRKEINVSKTTQDKKQGQRSQSNITKNIIPSYSSIDRKKEEDSDNNTGDSSRNSKGYLIDSKHTTNNKDNKNNKFFSKKIVITPVKEKLEKRGNDYNNAQRNKNVNMSKYTNMQDKASHDGQKYFNKNIVIQPVIAGKTNLGKNKYVASKISSISNINKNEISTTNKNKSSSVSTVRTNIKGIQSKTQIQQQTQNISNIRTNIYQAQAKTQTNTQNINNINRRGMRGVSTDDKKIVKKIDLLNGVQYFTKNIVIEPVKNYRYISNKIEKSESSNKSMSNKNGRRQWEVNAKNNEDGIMGHYLSNNIEIITEDMIKNIPGIDENTKFYHKEITITPVFMPPLRFDISQ